MAHTSISLAIVAILVMTQTVSAKRGCSAFGHSCFGGHGKRSSDSAMGPPNPDMMDSHQLGQEETPPHPGYPRSYNILSSADDIIPVRDGGLYDRDDASAREVMMKYRLRNLVKHWMDTYRRSQNEDGYFVDNL